MAMPNQLVFIRHGFSEANTVHRVDKEGGTHPLEAEINGRPDWQQRLSKKGIEQAIQAKAWIDENLGGLALFDVRYVSPFLRTRETAAYLSGPGTDVTWTIDDRIAERSWGNYGRVPRAEQRALFPHTAAMQKLTPWYVRFDGGESMPDVFTRFRDFQGTLHREFGGGRVAVVAHGDLMNVARYAIERMTPEQWEAMDGDPRYTIRNCSILQYSRMNPDNEDDVREKITWRRMVYTDKVDGKVVASPDNGEWIELPPRQHYTADELLAQVEMAPALLGEVE
jgi:broad specificity phosphatase PhoE